MLPAGVNMVAVVNNTVAIVVAVAGAVALIAILLAIGALIRTLATLRIAVEQLQRQTTPLVGDLQSAVQRTNDSLGRVDNILDTAESISVTVDSASRLAYLTFSNPVVKGLA